MGLHENARLVFEGMPLSIESHEVEETTAIQLKNLADAHLAIVAHQVVSGLVLDEARELECRYDFFRSAQSDISGMLSITEQEQGVVLHRFFEYLHSRYGSGEEQQILEETDLGKITKEMCIEYHDEAQRVLDAEGVPLEHRGPVSMYADPKQVIRIGLGTTVSSAEAIMKEVYRSTDQDSARRLMVLKKSRPSALRIAKLPLHIASQESATSFDSGAQRVLLHEDHDAKISSVEPYLLQSVRPHSGCLGLIRLPSTENQPRSAINMMYDHIVKMIAEARIEQLDFTPAKGEIMPPFMSKLHETLRGDG